MSSLKSTYLSDLRLGATNALTLRKLGEHQGREQLFTKQSPEVLETLKQVALIESTESSNRIEGITAPRNRVQALALQSTRPKDRSEQEIAGYRDALDLIHASAEHMPFSVNVIRQCHKLLFQYLPSTGGHYKGTDNDIVEKDPDGKVIRVRFRPVSAVRTPSAMEDLEAFYRNADREAQQDPLVFIPLAILDFLCIHPFSGGNGRVARLLTLLLLYHHGYGVGRYISLERIIEESKETYYETLESSSTGWHHSEHNVMPWLQYWWGMLIRAYGEFEERVGTIRTGRGAKSQMIEQAVERRIGPFAVSDLESELPNINRDTIRSVLRRLRDQGRIHVQGKGRGAKWVKITQP